MRVLLKSEFSSDAEIEKMKQSGALPQGVLVRTDPETGRRYFNWVYRLSTDIDWKKIQHYVEAISNLVRTYCDLVEEGIYKTEDGRIMVIVILKRNESSGVTWEETEIYGQGVSPKDISDAHYLFCQEKIPLTAKWSSGIPYSDKSTSK